MMTPNIAMAAQHIANNIEGGDLASIEKVMNDTLIKFPSVSISSIRSMSIGAAACQREIEELRERLDEREDG